MRRIILWGSLAGLAGCSLDPAFVQILPDYGYVDGCTDVQLSGHDLGETATATIGGEDLPIVPAEYDDSLQDWAQDVGFEYFGQTPPAPGGAAGFTDVTMNVDGVELTIPEAFYYRACPYPSQVDTYYATHADGSVDGTSSTPDMAEGETINVIGCGLSSDITVRIMTLVNVTTTTTTTGPGTVTNTTLTQTPTTTDICYQPAVEVATATLVPDCSTARAHFDIPAGLPDGAYVAWFEKTAGTDVGYYTYYGYGYCVPPTFTVGAATTGGTP